MNQFHTTANLSFMDTIRYPEITILQRSFTFITGKSGCGKSTYLKILNRSIPSQKNTVFFRDKSLTDYEILPYRRQVLLIPQTVYLIKDSILDNFAFYYENRQEPMPSEERMKFFLSLCSLDMELHASCDTLSGGERQRVFLAVFLSFAQDTVLLDEPTAALDDKTAEIVMKNLKKYFREQNLTAVCVCHNRYIVKKYADTVIDMEKLTHA
ncbi:MAG: energy-coupling factor ABC transporter ATP-binding protein [Candidatus Treponema excrementipullorum]|nr:energy-coupling factor ABC transporter ATP-binding protein [Candidatus Treponema excrementipullorum]